MTQHSNRLGNYREVDCQDRAVSSHSTPAYLEGRGTQPAACAPSFLTLLETHTGAEGLLLIGTSLSHHVTPIYLVKTTLFPSNVSTALWSSI